MKTVARISHYIILAAMITLSSATLSMAQDFEGIIQYKFPGMTGNGTGSMKYMIQDDKLRIQMGGNGLSAAMLYLPKESSMVMLMDKMQSYMKMELNQKTLPDDYNKEWKGSTMEKTGQTKTVAGHECEVWVVTAGDGDTLNMCMAQGLGTFMAPGNPMAKENAPAWAHQIIADGYMPLEVIKTTGGEQQHVMQATKIEQKALDADLFKIPEGYRDMSAMMEQMQNIKNR